MSKTAILLLASIMTIMTACMETETKDALASLDNTIAGCHIYRSRFMEKTERMRQRFEDSGQECGHASKWDMADSMYMAYMHYQSDSSSRYLRIMRECAGTQREKSLTDMAEIRMRLTMCDIWTAYEHFTSADTSTLAIPEVLKEYLSTGMSVYYNLVSASKYESGKTAYYDRLDSLRTRYILLFPDSMEGMRYKAQQLRDIGETASAEAIFLELYRTQTDFHTLASVSYNLAAIYKGNGEKGKAMAWMARAAEYDFKTPDRNYLSLYDLAMMCYDEGMLGRARKYISRNMTDIIDGNISSRIFNSSQTHLVLEEAAEKERQTIFIVIVSLAGIIGILSAILCIMLHRSHKINKMLYESNMSLHDSNLIKDSYVFRYMSLSIEYLEGMGNLRSRLRQTAQNEGVDAMMRLLKSPSEMYSEYDRFYRIFDEIFLGIYPDFVQKVNNLMKDGHQFEQIHENTLTTELRILAAIRIGITQSGKIATFLKCSPATVYTYRTRMRNCAKCPKDEFEAAIKKL